MFFNKGNDNENKWVSFLLQPFEIGIKKLYFSNLNFISLMMIVSTKIYFLFASIIF